mmetsp:Transcript_53154/g.99654  ORF Transcript_53154/g.99654 Transcript_53154/m.99654 type:complete len:237 (-) Transcript_53154:27-737(-)
MGTCCQTGIVDEASECLAEEVSAHGSARLSNRSMPESIESRLTWHDVDDAQIFEVRLNCTREARAGVLLDNADEKVCLVKSIPDGLLKDWNANSMPNLTVKPKHRLLLIDGKAGSSTEFMAELMTRATSVNLTFERPLVLRMALRRAENEELGLVMRANETDVSILDLQPGIIRSWNLSATPATTVKKSDRIIAVNGKQGSGSDLLRMIETDETLDLRVLSWQAQLELGDLATKFP